ncbi:GNAT family N-acetyltransferase [Vibrio vulnificus]|nr:GNAT family N-acetyltransferase [Vibrio vulnificus]ELC9574569.1 GNAT family N-acetyltransferase [Vibrio vulnificus]ELV8587768.1 GNAT family N-acetyltransferase [Vibrio vulnificus]ELV8631590.1 GNAT family N-acetyltransferase [Vibrio vulnificus]ELV8640108.1 GNAT family N-acetyltransferase [Vibrio vulnificus]
MIKKATCDDFEIVGQFVKLLLLEIEPSSSEEIDGMNFTVISQELLAEKKIIAFLAYDDVKPVGVITLCELGAIYAGGLFGEVNELYVLPAYRSMKFGNQLIESAVKYGKGVGWSKLQLGTPDQVSSKSVINFYRSHGFKGNGLRLGLAL